MLPFGEGVQGFSMEGVGNGAGLQGGDLQRFAARLSVPAPGCSHFLCSLSSNLFHIAVLGRPLPPHSIQAAAVLAVLRL